MIDKKTFIKATIINTACILLWGGLAIFDLSKRNLIAFLLEGFLVFMFVAFIIRDVFKYKAFLSVYEKNSISCGKDVSTIRGHEYKPKEKIKGVIVMAPDFMATSETLNHYAEYFVREGYITYTFDFNGGSVMGGKSDGQTTEMSVLTEVKDLDEVLTYVKNKNHKYSKDIILVGFGQGAFVSALLASELKTKIQQLILVSPSFNIPDNARAGYAMYGVFDPQNIPDVIPCGMMKLGRKYVDDVMDMNIYEEIKGYVHDVLIVHGSQDEVCDVKYAKQVYDIYVNNTNNKRKVELEIIDGASHSFTKQQEKLVIEKINQFIQK